MLVRMEELSLSSSFCVKLQKPVDSGEKLDWLPHCVLKRLASFLCPSLCPRTHSKVLLVSFRILIPSCW